jgi:hypothetical protein
LDTCSETNKLLEKSINRAKENSTSVCGEVYVKTRDLLVFTTAAIEGICHFKWVDDVYGLEEFAVIADDKTITSFAPFTDDGK